MAQKDCITLNGFATYVNQLHVNNNNRVDEGNITVNRLSIECWGQCMDPYVIELVCEWWWVERDMKNAWNILVGKFECKGQFWIQEHK